ncbi:MAG: FKBP-type peptidyl-prolyl cis-trans isomerase [Xanthomonadaceae bacterium]|nr:FKBP-type peptidyl-prolyl cis-trans isomerase [Xanthomonadaceae bacterium]
MVRTLILPLLIALTLVTGCSREPSEQATAEEAKGPPPPITDLQRIDLHVAPGEGISQGQVAVVHYTGWLYDPRAPENKGTKFDSYRDRGQPFRFVIGAGQVIRGWEEGVQGMRVGSQRRLIVPSDLAYGERGAGGGVIPPNATLVFDIELLAIEQADL